MKTSKAGIQFIESAEGCRLRAYDDGGGVWTIGYGHIKDVKPNDTCSLAQAEQWLSEDLAVAEAGVEAAIHVPLNDNQHSALVSFTFNLGSGALHSSTLARLLNAGDVEGAASEFPRWCNVGGKPSAGLMKRRAAEKKLFTTPMNE